MLEEVGGTIKENVGQLIGNEQMELEGRAKVLEGQAHQEAAKAKARIKGAAEELTGEAKGHVGKILDNEQMQVEGKLGAMKGQARQKLNE
ncbi:MAG: CsbD family protein [Deltaproteobacteria bacterium]|nr:CsbD family protein [Deltaproteobacteria bacterium]